MRSPVAERASSCRNTSRSENRQHLVDPDEGDERLGQRDTHSAVALRLDDDERAAFGDDEVRTRDRHLGPQETAPQMRPGGSREIGRVVREAVRRRQAPLGHVLQEDARDLGAVAVDRRHDDMAGQVVAELHDQLGEVRLGHVDARGDKGVVEPGLCGGHRLDLHDLVTPVLCTRPTTIRLASAASAAKWT